MISNRNSIMRNRRTLKAPESKSRTLEVYINRIANNQKVSFRRANVYSEPVPGAVAVPIETLRVIFLIKDGVGQRVDRVAILDHFYMRAASVNYVDGKLND